MKIEAVVFDFGRTIYDPVAGSLFPETIPTLEELKSRGIKLGLVTVAETDNTQERVIELNKLGITPFFQEIDVVGRSTKGKDFRRMLEAFNLADRPQVCAVVGDNLKREITSGNNIGAFTIWTKQSLLGDFKPQSPEQTPKATINNLGELIPLLDSIS